MGNNIICQRKPQDHIHVKQIDENARPGARLEDLPQDLVYKILSKLPPNEAAKTSGLSSKWRCIWSKCPRLCFDGLAMFKCESGDGLAMVLPRLMVLFKNTMEKWLKNFIPDLILTAYQLIILIIGLSFPCHLRRRI
ncbi:hypothetical protein E2562_024399 [Oryza meyeriana var. granulata]|uniref:F-box domain-containing protein n=1 Tax=Oryza meyeriana var. granulata TaxID=110450 RepID=A0A6G1C8V5_9ORYZ|nr:hypothetical protein E2562_024399 [Oryza meyeriana var. granulata]